MRYGEVDGGQGTYHRAALPAEPRAEQYAARRDPPHCAPLARSSTMSETHSNDEDESNEQGRLSNVFFTCSLLRKFIHMYKELPCLWDRHCAAYKQKQKRHEAITQLTKLVQKQHPTATRVHILRKIESLRACVRREHKRVRESWRYAKHASDVYKPHLWYYDLFSFMFTNNGPNFNSTDLPVKNESTSGPERPASESEEEEPRYEDEPNQFEQPDYSIATSIVEVSDNSKQRLYTEVGDEYDAIGINVAAKLRGLPSNMRILAEKLINDVLYKAQLNGLNSSTMISNPD